MMQLHKAPMPAMTVGNDVDLYELITVTSSLMALMKRETEHLKKMEIKEIGKLADEKQRLTKMMEHYQSLIKARPELVLQLDDASRADLADLTEEFAGVVAENMQRTAVARAVNQRVVTAIMEVASESKHAGTYNKYGSTAVPADMSVSFNLNQQA